MPVSSPAGMCAVGQEVSDVHTDIKAAADMGMSLCQGLRRWVGFSLRGCGSPASRFRLKQPSDSKAVGVLGALWPKSSGFVLGTGAGNKWQRGAEEGSDCNHMIWLLC